MPSVGCISAVLKKRSEGQPASSHFVSFPLIDPLDSFYLLNPGGDLTDTQDKFESWFRDQNFEVTYYKSIYTSRNIIVMLCFQTSIIAYTSGESWIRTKCYRVDRSIKNT